MGILTQTKIESSEKSAALWSLGLSDSEMYLIRRIFTLIG